MTDFEAKPVLRWPPGYWFDYEGDVDDGTGIEIDIIARSLSNTCRYAGRVPRHYSVAQHSVIVAKLVPPEHRAWALMHDAAEAWLGDVPRPAKTILPGYCELEDRVLARVAHKFGLCGEAPPPEVKHADLVALAAEARDLHGIVDPVRDSDIPVTLDEIDAVPPIVPVHPPQAEHRFMRWAEKLGLTEEVA